MDEYNIDPGFVPGAAGKLFKLDVTPVDDVRYQVLYLPPHGEELNRCRALIAAQARLLASNGVACRIIDYYGSGDSDGDFSAATWDIWQKDIALQLEQLKAKNQVPVILASFRLGCLAAVSFLEEVENNIAGLLLVQPVTQGKQYVNQLLRQRVARQISAGKDKETTDQLRALIQAGNNLEIGGYEFGSNLLIDLEKQSFADKASITGQEIIWIEIEQVQGKGLSLSAQRAIKKLEEQGNRVTAECVVDPPFWQLHERAQFDESLKIMEKVARQWAVM